MFIIKILVTFICGGTLCIGIEDILERKNINASDVLSIMFLLLIIVITWLV